MRTVRHAVSWDKPASVFELASYVKLIKAVPLRGIQPKRHHGNAFKSGSFAQNREAGVAQSIRQMCRYIHDGANHLLVPCFAQTNELICMWSLVNDSVRPG